MMFATAMMFSSCSNDDNQTEDKDSTSAYDRLMPIGFGEKTTGGGNQNISVVSTAAELDENHLNCTFVCCWWGEGCVERCPRVCFGKVHVVNCLYDGDDYNYCIGHGVFSNIYVENCAFITDAARDNALKDWRGDKDFNIKVTGCLGIDDTELSEGSREQFIPIYNYSAFNADMVESVLKNADTGAGPTLNIRL